MKKIITLSLSLFIALSIATPAFSMKKTRLKIPTAVLQLLKLEKEVEQELKLPKIDATLSKDRASELVKVSLVDLETYIENVDHRPLQMQNIESQKNHFRVRHIIRWIADVINADKIYKPKKTRDKIFDLWMQTQKADKHMDNTKMFCLKARQFADTCKPKNKLEKALVKLFKAPLKIIKFIPSLIPLLLLVFKFFDWIPGLELGHISSICLILSAIMSPVIAQLEKKE